MTMMGLKMDGLCRFKQAEVKDRCQNLHRVNDTGHVLRTFIICTGLSWTCLGGFPIESWC